VANKQWTVPTASTPGGGSGGSGTVTQVNTTAPVAGGPITTTGTISITGAAGQVLAGSGPAFTATPTLGVSGSAIGTLALAGNTSGTATITPQAAAGTPTLTLPNASGTFAVTASAPIVLNATTGALTAPTAVTSAASLTNNAVVLGAGGQATATNTAFTTNGTTTLTVGVAGGGNGVLALAGNTSGTATLTAPAVAGTSTNPIAVTNVFAGPDGSGTNPTYGFSSTANTGMFQFGGTLALKGTNLNIYNGSNTLTYQFASASGNFGFVNTKGQHFVTQAANNDLCGTFTVSSSTTGSVTFTTNYTSTPAVLLTPQTTGLTSWFISAVSNSGFTVTVAPSGTYTFAYHVIGNPN
jgi:hypothetical protein